MVHTFSKVFFFGCFLFGGAAAAVADVDLVLKAVEVTFTKPNGKSWDSGDGVPDIRVHISSGGQAYTSPVTMNAYTATINKKSLRIAPGDVLNIRVYDQDVFSDDFIGSYSKTITEETLRAGFAVWSFDQVTGMLVIFEP